MINFKFLFGLFPKTSDIEAKESALIKEYEELEIYKTSDELKQFFELKTFVESQNFKAKEEEIKLLVFLTSELFKKETEYNKLKKSVRIINYYKVINSLHYKNYLELSKSKELAEYFELKEFVNSESFKQKEAALKAMNYKGSEESNKEQEYLKLQKSVELKNYYKILGSENYKNYNLLNGSSDLEQYAELKKNAESEKIINLQKTIKEEKFINTPEFSTLKQYEELKKSPRIKLYFKVLQSEAYKKFNELNGSAEIKQFEELEKLVNSESFKELKKDKKSFEESENIQKEQTYLKLKSDNSIKAYNVFAKSKLYVDFKGVVESGEVQKFEELKKNVETDDFVKIKDYYKQSPDKKWQQHKEYGKVEEFEKLKKDPRFISYFKFSSSNEFKLFNEAVTNGLIEKFEALQNLVQSEDFKKNKEYLSLSFEKKWGQTDEFIKKQAFTKLSNEQKIKDYLKFDPSKEHQLFEEVLKSGEIEIYEKLQNEVNSDEFKQQKAYLLLPFKQKWEKTDEFSKWRELEKLKNSEKVKWYFSVVDSKKFENMLSWKLTFSDDFDKNELDKKVWLTKYFYGDAVLHDTYSLSDDRHLTTDGQNIKVQNSILSIETRSEKAMGKAWDPMFGFVPKEFEYTSGTINTGKSFRQKHGLFRAKIKMGTNKKITQSFWMVGGQIMPHIDIVKFVNGNFNVSNFWKSENNEINRNADKISGSKLGGNFYIYEMEWTPDELIWRVNNLEIKRIKNGIPSEEMYIQFSSGIFNNLNAEHLSASMEIDWVKCYTRI